MLRRSHFSPVYRALSIEAAVTASSVPFSCGGSTQMPLLHPAASASSSRAPVVVSPRRFSATRMGGGTTTAASPVDAGGDANPDLEMASIEDLNLIEVHQTASAVDINEGQSQPLSASALASHVSCPKKGDEILNQPPLPPHSSLTKTSTKPKVVAFSEDDPPIDDAGADQPASASSVPTSTTTLPPPSQRESEAEKTERRLRSFSLVFAEFQENVAAYMEVQQRCLDKIAGLATAHDDARYNRFADHPVVQAAARFVNSPDAPMHLGGTPGIIPPLSLLGRGMTQSLLSRIVSPVTGGLMILGGEFVVDARSNKYLTDIARDRGYGSPLWFFSALGSGTFDERRLLVPSSPVEEQVIGGAVLPGHVQLLHSAGASPGTVPDASAVVGSSNTPVVYNAQQLVPSVNSAVKNGERAIITLSLRFNDTCARLRQFAEEWEMLLGYLCYSSSSVAADPTANNYITHGKRKHYIRALARKTLSPSLAQHYTLVKLARVTRHCVVVSDGAAVDALSEVDANLKPFREKLLVDNTNEETGASAAPAHEHKSKNRRERRRSEGDRCLHQLFISPEIKWLLELHDLDRSIGRSQQQQQRRSGNPKFSSTEQLPEDKDNVKNNNINKDNSNNNRKTHSNNTNSHQSSTSSAASYSDNPPSHKHTTATDYFDPKVTQESIDFARGLPRQAWWEVRCASSSSSPSGRPPPPRCREVDAGSVYDWHPISFGEFKPLWSLKDITKKESENGGGSDGGDGNEIDDATHPKVLWIRRIRPHLPCDPVVQQMHRYQISQAELRKRSFRAAVPFFVEPPSASSSSTEWFATTGTAASSRAAGSNFFADKRPHLVSRGGGVYHDQTRDAKFTTLFKHKTFKGTPIHLMIAKFLERATGERSRAIQEQQQQQQQCATDSNTRTCNKITTHNNNADDGEEDNHNKMVTNHSSGEDGSNNTNNNNTGADQSLSSWNDRVWWPVTSLKPNKKRVKRGAVLVEMMLSRRTHGGGGELVKVAFANDADVEDDKFA